MGNILVIYGNNMNIFCFNGMDIRGWLYKNLQLNFLKGDLWMHQQPVRSVDCGFEGILGFLPPKRRCHVKMRYLMYQLNAFCKKPFYVNLMYQMSTFGKESLGCDPIHLFPASFYHWHVKGTSALAITASLGGDPGAMLLENGGLRIGLPPTPKILTRKPLEGWWFVYRCFSFCRFGAAFKLPCYFVFEVYPYEHFYGIGVDTLPWFHNNHKHSTGKSTIV